MASTTPEILKEDYGKNTIFRFSIINDKQPTISRNIKDIVPVIKPPVSAQAMMMNGGDNQAASQTNLDDLIALNSELFYFGEWLADYKSNIDLIKLEDKMEEITALSSSDEAIVWDFLRSQIISKNDFMMSKAINFLRANAMINAKNQFSEEEEMPPMEVLLELAYDIANAPIVMPEDLISEFSPQQIDSPNRFDNAQAEMMKTRHHAAKQKYIIENSEQVIEAVDGLESAYQKAKNEAYNEEYQNYLENLPTPSEPEEGENPEPIEWPKFTFEFPALDWEFAQSLDCFKHLPNIAEEIESALGENASKCFTKDVIKFKKYFEKKLDKARSSLYNTLPVTPIESFTFNGSEIVVDNRPPDNSFLIQLAKLMPEHKQMSLIITHFTKGGAVFIEDIDLSLSINDSALNNGGEFKKVFSTSEFETLVCFENQISLGSPSNDEISLFGKLGSDDTTVEIPVNVRLNYDKVQLFTISSLNSAEDMDGGSMLKLDAVPGVDDQMMYGIKRVGVLEYMKVDQEICCYVAGEVSHIENIMAREYKEKVSRLLTRAETSTEESEDREEENTRDVSSTERYEMQKEIATMLSKERSMQLAVNAGVSATYSSDPWQVNVNAGMNLNTSNSSSSSTNTSQAETIAKEVTQKATDRLLKKVSYKRTSKMLREQEETNKHGFDNRSGASHVTGIYRWVDKIYKNSLYNYGKRLIYEFSIPEPSRNFKTLTKKALASKSNNKKAKPIPPKHPVTFLGETDPLKMIDGDLTNFNWDGLDRLNYARLAAYYKADVEACPEEVLHLGKSFAENPTGNVQKWDERMGSYKFEAEIPEGYKCTNYWGKYAHVFSYKTNGKEQTQSESVLKIDTKHFHFMRPFNWKLCFDNDGYGNTYFQNDNQYLGPQKFLPISISTFNVGGFSIDITYKCELTKEAFDQWRQQAYMAIVTAYMKKYQEYLDAMMVEPETEDTTPDYNMNPGKARAIEARELKRACIEIMGYPLSAFYDNFDMPNTGSKNHHLYFENNFLGLHHHFIIKDQKLNRHAQVIKFFEEAFEWDLMSYTFHPYFSGERESWEDLLRQKAPSDPLFEAFLQSGFSTVQLTVKPEYERMVLYFLDTGTIAPSKDFMPPGDLSVYNALLSGLKVYTDKEQEERKLVKTWETRLPTDLVIIQSGARPLQRNGLPCACKDGIAQEGLGTGTDEEMSTLQPYTSDYGDLIVDIKNAVIDVVKGVVPVLQGAGGDKEPANPGTGGTTDGGTTGGTTDGGGNGDNP